MSHCDNNNPNSLVPVSFPVSSAPALAAGVNIQQGNESVKAYQSSTFKALIEKNIKKQVKKVTQLQSQVNEAQLKLSEEESKLTIPDGFETDFNTLVASLKLFRPNASAKVVRVNGEAKLVSTCTVDSSRKTYTSSIHIVDGSETIFNATRVTVLPQEVIDAQNKLWELQKELAAEQVRLKEIRDSRNKADDIAEASIGAITAAQLRETEEGRRYLAALDSIIKKVAEDNDLEV